jgi:hypothetical protein
VPKVPKSALNFLSLTAWTERNIIPYYKGARANVRRMGSMAEYQRTRVVQEPALWVN